PSIQFVQPFVLNSVTPSHLLIGTNYVYESTDNGRTLTLLNGAPVELAAGFFIPDPAANVGTVSSLVYGGRQPDGAGGFTDEPDIIYVGNKSSASPLGARKAGGGKLVGVKSWTDKAGQVAVRDVAVDPDDWRKVYVLDANGQIWYS